LGPLSVRFYSIFGQGRVDFPRTASRPELLDEVGFLADLPAVDALRGGDEVAAPAERAITYFDDAQVWPDLRSNSTGRD
jgi:hypothetical protein